MSVSVTLKSYFYEVLIPSSQKNTSSPIEDILHHVSISFMKKLALYKCFNPRTHTGCDASIALIRFIYHRFQSTHPHGVRRHKKCTAERLISFNPRTHTGCDSYVESYKTFLNVSIHAPTRGATLGHGDRYPHGHGFQSTHPHGVRL